MLWASLTEFNESPLVKEGTFKHAQHPKKNLLIDVQQAMALQVSPVLGGLVRGSGLCLW